MLIFKVDKGAAAWPVGSTLPEDWVVEAGWKVWLE